MTARQDRHAAIADLVDIALRGGGRAAPPAAGSDRL
jgi:hypothetical protein